MATGLLGGYAPMITKIFENKIKRCVRCHSYCERYLNTEWTLVQLKTIALKLDLAQRRGPRRRSMLFLSAGNLIVSLVLPVLTLGSGEMVSLSVSPEPL